MAMCWPFGHRLRAVEHATVQSQYSASFSREMGCTEPEWLGWLPAAIGAHPWTQTTNAVDVAIQVDAQTTGRLHITWRVGEPRVIALARIPRLLVDFVFEGLDDVQRYQFMRRFDLYMQRGGG